MPCRMVRQGLEDVGYFPLPNLDLTKCLFNFIAPLSFRNWFESFHKCPSFFFDLSVAVRSYLFS